MTQHWSLLPISEQIRPSASISQLVKSFSQRNLQLVQNPSLKAQIQLVAQRCLISLHLSRFQTKMRQSTSFYPFESNSIKKYQLHSDLLSCTLFSNFQDPENSFSKLLFSEGQLQMSALRLSSRQLWQALRLLPSQQQLYLESCIQYFQAEQLL